MPVQLELPLMGKLALEVASRNGIRPEPVVAHESPLPDHESERVVRRA
jgi:hypothetical protein